MNEPELLIKGWKETNLKVYLIESDKYYKMYQVYKEYEQKNNFYRNKPVYFIFYENKNIMCTTNYVQACIYYVKCVGE